MNIADFGPSTDDLAPGSEANAFLSAEQGLNFAYAHEVAARHGIDLGAGVRIIHYDEGWALNHPCFDSIRKRPDRIRCFGEPNQDRASHGTSVLGLHCGVPPAIRHNGELLPGATFSLATIHYDETTEGEPALEQALEDARTAQATIVLIARDWSSRAAHLPWEMKSGRAEFIRKLTERGVCVVESGGNGGADLDRIVRRSNEFVHDQVTNDADPWINAADEVQDGFKFDSGAIIVGACTNSVTPTRWTGGFPTNPQPRSNFGSRIDCWAQGEQIFAATTDGPNAHPSYTSSFGGTSSAAAIIAAAIAAIQSIALTMSYPGRPLTPSAMRDLLRDRRFGRPVKENDRALGAIPNLRAILDHVSEHPPAHHHSNHADRKARGAEFDLDSTGEHRNDR